MTEEERHKLCGEVNYGNDRYWGIELRYLPVGFNTSDIDAFGRVYGRTMTIGKSWAVESQSGVSDFITFEEAMAQVEKELKIMKSKREEYEGKINDK